MTSPVTTMVEAFQYEPEPTGIWEPSNGKSIIYIPRLKLHITDEGLSRGNKESS